MKIKWEERINPFYEELRGYNRHRILVAIAKKINVSRYEFTIVDEKGELGKKNFIGSRWSEVKEFCENN